MSKRSHLRRRDKLFIVALVAGLVVAGYEAFDYRKNFIQSFFVRGPGQLRAPKLPAGDSSERLVRSMDQVRVVLIDGVGSRTAHRLPGYNELCAKGLDVEVDIGFPTVSLPVQTVLWTGLTPQQTGIQYVWKLLDPPLDGVPAAVESSIAVAEDKQYIAHSLGFETTLPQTPKFSDAGEKNQWMAGEFERAALEAIQSDTRLAFVHILRTDNAGHAHGPESSDYEIAAKTADVLLGQLVSANPPDADTMWLVVSDHGHITGGGHAGADPDIRIVRACLAGGQLHKGKIARRIHLVDLYRALETALDVGSELDSPGRPLAAAITAPDSTGATLPRPGARWIPALLIIAVGLLAGFIAARGRGWGFAWWWLVAYVSVVAIEAAPTLSNPMIYKPLGQTMYMAAIPGFLVLAASAGLLLRRHNAARVTVSLIGLPLATTLASYVLCRGQPPLMPLWTAHTSLLLTLLAIGCWVVALAHLVVSVPRVFGLVKAPETTRKDP